MPFNKRRLREAFDYKDGSLYRKPSLKKAGCRGERYSYVGLDYKMTYLHRVIWIWHHGNIPKGQVIDHINHDTFDNRIENLRLVTPVGNSRNLPRHPKSRHGAMGVRLRSWGSWEASIGVGGTNNRIYLGSFKTEAEAVAARLEAEVKYGFHPNHGRVVELEAA